MSEPYIAVIIERDDFTPMVVGFDGYEKAVTFVDKYNATAIHSKALMARGMIRPDSALLWAESETGSKVNGRFR